MSIFLHRQRRMTRDELVNLHSERGKRELQAAWDNLRREQSDAIDRNELPRTPTLEQYIDALIQETE